jgi:tetratricopeptide (TPR) repeat protein
MELDTNTNFTREIATLYMKSKDFNKAADVYQLTIDKGSEDINDYFGLGRAYYYSEQFGKADTAFMKMVEMRPELALSYLWRAKANTHIDPKNEKWLAKPFYETFIQKVGAEELDRNKTNLVNAHTYLAAYYASQKDLENTKLQFEEVLKIDANNAQAKKFLETAK